MRASWKSRYYRVWTVFFKYAISYFLIISILFATIGTYSYSTALSANEQKVKGEIENLLQEDIRRVDAGIYALREMAAALAADQDIEILRQVTEEGVGGWQQKLDQISQKLSPYANAMNYLDSLYLLFEKSGTILSSQGVGLQGEAFYREYLEPTWGMSYDQWRSALLSQEEGAPLVWAYQEGQQAFQWSCVYGEKGERLAVSMALDPQIYCQSLVGTEYLDTAVLVVRDSQGQVVYATDPLKGEQLLRFLQTDESGYLSIDGTHYDSFSNRSQWGYTYDLAVATDDIIAINDSIRNGFVLVYLIVLLVTVVLSLIFAVSTSRPISSIITAIDEADTHQESGEARHTNDLSYINRSVSTMAQRNVRLQREIEAFTLATRENFFYKLLEGDPITPREIRMVGDDVSRIFGYNSYVVAVIQFYSYEDDEEKIYWEISKSMVLAWEKLDGLEKEGIYLHKCGYDRLALIICDQKKMDRAYLEQRMEPLTRALVDATQVDFSCAMGDICENCDQIYISYQNACYVLGNQELSRTGELCWAQDASRKLQLNFPVETEQRLINAICLGNTDQAREMVDLLFEGNGEAIHVSRRQLSYFVSAMTVVFLRVCSQLSDLTEECQQQVNLYLWQMRNVTDVESVRQYVYLLIDQVTSIAASRGEQRSKNQLEKIMVYIGEHFAEDTLCLSSIAKHFNLTESYVSTFFKQQTDSNISLYIEKVRMDHARMLVRTSGLPTKEIAVQCGYQNLNTFYKAFKRNFGVSPKDYKNLPEQEL